MCLLFRYLQLCHTLPEVLKIPGSKVVLTSWPDLECGFARDLFALWCSDARNSVVLTSRSGAGTLGRKLYDQPGLKQVTLELKQRVKLEGMELEEHRRRKEREKAIHGPTGQNDPMAVESSEDEDEGMRQKPGRQERIRHDIVVRSEDGKNNVSGVGVSGVVEEQCNTFSRVPRRIQPCSPSLKRKSSLTSTAKSSDQKITSLPTRN